MNPQDEKILRKQLTLLSEYSETYTKYDDAAADLCAIAEKMCKIVSLLNSCEEKVGEK
ncbi:MAG: hypothetical protein HFE63_10865 [Clostridiales bacterium]|nr:hypothetical protein [Clostridiales bacterium]